MTKYFRKLSPRQIAALQKASRDRKLLYYQEMMKKYEA